MRRLLPYSGLMAMVVALLVRQLLASSPTVYQQFWFEGLFPRVRTVQVFLFGWSPLAGYYLLLGLLLFFVIWRFPRKAFKRMAGWLAYLRRMANLAGWLVFSFLFLWGFNYLDPGMGSRMGIAVASGEQALAEAYLQAMDRAAQKRSKVAQLQDLPHVEALEHEVDMQDLHQSMRQVLADLGYPMEPEVPVRYLRPAGLLRRLGISGIFNPWTGEANVDAAFGPLPRLFTTAHEMAHGYGISSEAEANFAAYLCCLYLDDPLGPYAAEYALWRSLGSEVNKSYPAEVIEALAAAIPAELAADRLAIWQSAMQHQAYFPELTDGLNDRYLKIQGVEAGVEDYNAFVGLYLAWEAARNSSD